MIPLKRHAHLPWWCPPRKHLLWYPTSSFKFSPKVCGGKTKQSSKKPTFKKPKSKKTKIQKPNMLHAPNPKFQKGSSGTPGGKAQGNPCTDAQKGSASGRGNGAVFFWGFPLRQIQMKESQVAKSQNVASANSDGFQGIFETL